jgi:DNA-binding NtrC family response regulator
MKILLVDDESDIQLAFKELLERNPNYSVELAGSGNTAVDKLRDTNYDVVITDMAMKDGNGEQVLNYVKMQKTLGQKAANVIVVTGYFLTPDLMNKWSTLGALRIIKKPCQVSTIDTILKTIK